MDKERNDVDRQKACQCDAGVAVDIALDDEVNQKLVDQETKTLNNNPRNDDME